VNRRGGAAAIGFVALLAACTAAYLPSEPREGAPGPGPLSDGARSGTAQPLAVLGAPDRRVGRIAAHASGHCRLQECALGSLVADAVLWHYANQGAVAAILPSNAIRGFLREGDVRNGDIETALAAERVGVREMRGAEIRVRLEEALRASTGEAAAFPQVAGLRYVWSPSHPPGRRLMSVEVADGAGRYAPLSIGKLYRVALRTAEASGGDVDLPRIFAVYLEQRSPLIPPAPGRIVER